MHTIKSMVKPLLIPFFSTVNSPHLHHFQTTHAKCFSDSLGSRIGGANAVVANWNAIQQGQNIYSIYVDIMSVY